MEDKQHFHLDKQERQTSSAPEEVSSPHNIHNQSKEPMHKTEPLASDYEQHHPHPPHHSAQPKKTDTLTRESSSISPQPMNYNINIQFDPVSPQAGKPTHFNLIVTEQKVGEPIKQFDIIHDKLMHLIIVNSEDLSHFAHIHPKLDKETGVFHITHTFQKAGRYKVWIDAKPKDRTQVLTAFAFNVEGQPVHTPVPIEQEQNRTKNMVVDGQSYQVLLSCKPEDLIAYRTVTITFEIRDANNNNKPIKNLEPLMAAGGHCVVISADAQEFLHVHPAEEVNSEDIASWRGGPSISFLANFPKPGLYRAWGQFQHEGRIITADFTFEVVAG
jgi:hypothetical protein